MTKNTDYTLESITFIASHELSKIVKIKESNIDTRTFYVMLEKLVQIGLSNYLAGERKLAKILAAAAQDLVDMEFGA